MKAEGHKESEMMCNQDTSASEGSFTAAKMKMRRLAVFTTRS